MKKATATKPATIDKPDIKLATSVVPYLRLESVLTPQIAARITDPREPSTYGYRVERARVAWGMSNQAAIISIVSFALHIIDPENDQDEHPHILAEIAATYRLEYVLLEDMTFSGDVLAALPHFAAISGFMHAYPFFRADVQMLSTKMGYPALTVGTLTSGEVVSRVSVLAEPLKTEVDAPSTEADAPSAKDERQSSTEPPVVRSKAARRKRSR
ncbi:hypothetical protein WME94_45435 [Sorangium sp. So ce429]